MDDRAAFTEKNYFPVSRARSFIINFSSYSNIQDKLKKKIITGRGVGLTKHKTREKIITKFKWSVTQRLALFCLATYQVGVTEKLPFWRNWKRAEDCLAESSSARLKWRRGKSEQRLFRFSSFRRTRRLHSPSPPAEKAAKRTARPASDSSPPPLRPPFTYFLPSLLKSPKAAGEAVEAVVGAASWASSAWASPACSL